jgi:hypothetical protein
LVKNLYHKNRCDRTDDKDKNVTIVETSSHCAVFFIDEVEYDNPILNHPKILKAVMMNLHMSLSEVIHRFSGFDKEFVEQAV